jgi:hypothetical protein
VCSIHLDVGLFAIMVGGALLTLCISWVVIGMMMSVTLCSTLCYTVCSAAGGEVPKINASRCLARRFITLTVQALHLTVINFREAWLIVP